MHLKDLIPCAATMAVVFLSPVQALALCTLGLSVNNISPAYDMFDNTEYGLVVDFDVTHTNGDSCSWFVSFSDGGASSYDRRMVNGAEQLSYQLYDSASKTNVLKDEIDATGAEVLSGTITSGDTSPVPLTYYLVIPEHQIKAAGAYTDTYTLTVYEGTLGAGPTLDSSANITLTTVVAKQIELSLVDTSGVFDPADTSQTLNFGVLSEAESLGFDTLVRTNAGYSMTMLSENQGKLLLSGQTAKASTTISYTLKVDDVAKDLSGGTPVQVASGSGATVLSGTARNITVTIGSVTGKAAGTYEDNITITVSTTE